MQLYALDENRFIVAPLAKRHKDYRCPECQGILRLRGGLHKQMHFYHTNYTRHCAQSKKTIPHINLQLFLQNLLPKGDVTLEKPFKKVRRIADVFWESAAIVFEIQCSSITLEEARQRIYDYESEGVSIVWILHTDRFNKKNVSKAELLLRQFPCYFAKTNNQKEICIYDQEERFYRGKRIWKGPSYPVDLSKPLLSMSNVRGWKLHFSGDWIDRTAKLPNTQNRSTKPTHRLHRFLLTLTQILYSFMAN